MLGRFLLLLVLCTVPACQVGDEPEVVRSGAAEGSAGGEAGARPGAAAPSPAPAPNVVFLGTSLTAGLGLLREDDTYPALIQRRIDAAGLPFRVVNAGVSGETSAGGLRRLDWVLRSPVGVLVLELGANDGLRGQDPEAMRANLDAIIEGTRARYPDAEVVVLGMEAPPNMGPRYTRAFRAVFREVAEAHGAALVPFFLEGVAGSAELNQADRIHPNARGHEIMAANVWEVLEPVLRRKAAQ